jgi:hypothetical protein
MHDLSRDQPLEFVNELVKALRGEVETKQLDRYEPVAPGVVRSEDGAERSRAYLIKHPVGTEGFGQRGPAGICVQS